MKKLFIPLLCIALLLSACSTKAAEADNLANRPIRITTTIGMVSDIVSMVGGNRVEVTGLMGSGVDPHLYKASESDVTALQEADIIFYNGLHLEAGMSGVLERMSDHRKVVAITDTIDRRLLNTPPEFKGAYDPHVWFDVSLWMHAVEVVRDSLISIDPASKDLYEANAKAYLTELEQLDRYVREQAERLPQEKRVLITAHDAFNYFGKAYGFDVHGLQGISTESEASTANVQQLADFIAASQVPAIFIESSVPQRNIEALQKAVESRGWNVRIGGELYSDAMGSAGTPDGTYIGMIRHNIDTIVNALSEK